MKTYEHFCIFNRANLFMCPMNHYLWLDGAALPSIKWGFASCEVAVSRLCLSLK